MATPVGSDLDFAGVVRLLNVPNATSDQEPATLAQLKAQIDGLKWKRSVRARAGGNINLASPGASIGGVTMASGDRFLGDLQTSLPSNGIYVWNGATTPATRALDANTFDELVAAVVTVEEGTYAGTKWRQTEVGGTIDVDDIAFEPFNPDVPPASTTVAGVARVATQVDVDTGLVSDEFVTPETLANYAGLARQKAFLVGDQSNTSYTVNHDFNSYNIDVEVWETGGNRRKLWGTEIRKPSVNQATLVFASAPATDAYLVLVSNK